MPFGLRSLWKDMPIIYNNKLTVRSNNPRLLHRFENRVKGTILVEKEVDGNIVKQAAQTVFSFNRLRPMPNRLYIPLPDNQPEREIEYRERRRRYRQATDIEWKIARWGAFHEAKDAKLEIKENEKLIYTFKSVDELPARIITHISSRFTPLNITLDWTEGERSGFIEFLQGQIIDSGEAHSDDDDFDLDDEYDSNDEVLQDDDQPAQAQPVTEEVPSTSNVPF